MLQQNQLTIHRASERRAPPFLSADRQASAPVASVAQIAVMSDLDLIEDEWRALELCADCTPFQSFEWLATWQRCIGAPAGVTPAIVTGRRATGELLFLLPLAVERTRFIRQLTFLGHALCDYNAPLLAPDFSGHVSADDFRAVWSSMRLLLQRTAGCQHDLVLLDKMPERVGCQPNPLIALATMLHPSRAYLTALGEDWDSFYAEKRSLATRRRDRTKRKKLAELGGLRVVWPKAPEEIRSTLSALFAQKSRWFARMGIPDLFAQPGHSDFFVSVANAGGRFVHVSRLDVGATCAAASLGLLFRDCYYHVLASYDDGPVSRFGPGAAHLHELMSHAISQGCRRFDFTIGDESYKRDWADTKINLYDHVSGAGCLGRLAAAAIVARLRAKRWIKNSPLMWTAASRFRSVLASIRRRPISDSRG